MRTEHSAEIVMFLVLLPVGNLWLERSLDCLR